MTAGTYDCCEHCSCPEASEGHPTPCRTCGQRLQRTADEKAARAMAGRRPSSAMTTGYNSRGRSLGRSTGRRMTLTGRASAEGTLQWRHDHAVPLPPGRCWCPVCWREYEVLNGFPRRHGCIPERAVVLLGPLRPPPAEEAPKPPVVHAPGLYGDGNARCGQPSVHLLSEDDPTCIRCIRRLAYEVRSVL